MSKQTKDVIYNDYSDSQIKPVKRINQLYSAGKTDTLRFSGWKNTDFNMLSPISSCVNVKYPNHDALVSYIKYYPSPVLLSGDSSLKDIYRMLLSGDSNNTNSQGNQSIERTLTNHKLIPLRIRFSNIKTKSRNEYVNSIILWYLITPELIAALPDRYKETVQKEFGIIKAIEKGRATLESACEALSGENTVLDICRSNSEVIKDLKVFPFPSYNYNANINFCLMEKRNLKINIHDFSGRFIKEYYNLMLSPGDFSYYLDLSDLSSGFYLISVISDKGEHVIQKLIKK